MTKSKIPIGEMMKHFGTQTMTDHDGWVEWDGGECPCDYRSVVEVRLRSGNERMARGALSWEWKHHNSICDIIAYRIIPEQPTNQNGEQ